MNAKSALAMGIKNTLGKKTQVKKVAREVSEGLGKYTFFEYFASNMTNKTTTINKICKQHPTSQAKTKDVDDLFSNECHLIDLKIHPTIVPFLTAMKPVKSGIWAYIAPVNHNSINTSRVASITITMLGNYCQDTENYDIPHLPDMGTDAGVLFGYFDRVCIHFVHILQYIQILNILFHCPYSAIYLDSECFVF